jgi:HAMP domain-containing protein
MNALLLIAAVVVTIVALAPRRISSFTINEEVLVLAAALTLLACMNLFVLRRFIRPLQALTALARRVDLTDPGERMSDAEVSSEAGELALTFNQMPDRLEASAGRRPAGCWPDRRRSGCGSPRSCTTRSGRS